MASLRYPDTRQRLSHLLYKIGYQVANNADGLLSFEKRIAFPKSKLKLPNIYIAISINKGYLKLIITYSESRAKKDSYNRNKGIRRLEKQIKRGRLTKTALNRKAIIRF